MSHRWIDIRDRLPELNIPVLIFLGKYHTPDIEKAILQDDNEYDRKYARKKDKYPPKLAWYGGYNAWPNFELDKVTHWMDMPEKPKEDQHFIDCIPVISGCWHTRDRICDLKEKCDSVGSRYKCCDKCPLRENK